MQGVHAYIPETNRVSRGYYHHRRRRHLLCAGYSHLYMQWNPVKTFLKIPRKSYFLSGKFLKRVGLKSSIF
jgi:hypothetical protein